MEASGNVVSDGISIKEWSLNILQVASGKQRHNHQYNSLILARSSLTSPVTKCFGNASRSNFSLFFKYSWR